MPWNVLYQSLCLLLRYFERPKILTCAIYLFAVWIGRYLPSKETGFFVLIRNWMSNRKQNNIMSSEKNTKIDRDYNKFITIIRMVNKWTSPNISVALLRSLKSLELGYIIVPCVRIQIRILEMLFLYKQKTIIVHKWLVKQVPSLKFKVLRSNYIGLNSFSPKTSIDQKYFPKKL